MASWMSPSLRSSAARIPSWDEGVGDLGAGVPDLDRLLVGVPGELVFPDKAFSLTGVVFGYVRHDSVLLYHHFPLLKVGQLSQNAQRQSGTRLVWAKSGSMLQSRWVATRLPASILPPFPTGRIIVRCTSSASRSPQRGQTPSRRSTTRWRSLSMAGAKAISGPPERAAPGTCCAISRLRRGTLSPNTAGRCTDRRLFADCGGDAGPRAGGTWHR